MVELADMQLFVRAVAAGSLSAAGRELNLSPAVASKRLSRLEQHLGVRLLQRSSRRLVLTAAGADYWQRVSAILADLDEAHARLAAGQQEARGNLHVAAPNALGRRWVGPLLGEFAARHPQLNLRLSLSDRLIDLLDNGIDLAVRIGTPPDSRLVSRRLAGNRRLICAAPSYLARHGTPQVPQDLLQHQCLVLQRAGMPGQSWSFHTEQGLESPRVQGRLSADSGEQLADWARAGLGLVIKSSWDVVEDLASGRLVTVLDDFCGPEMDIHLVYPSRQFVPNRLRLLIDFLLERFAAAEAEQQRRAR